MNLIGYASFGEGFVLELLQMMRVVCALSELSGVIQSAVLWAALRCPGSAVCWHLPRALLAVSMFYRGSYLSDCLAKSQVLDASRVLVLCAICIPSLLHVQDLAAAACKNGERYLTVEFL